MQQSSATQSLHLSFWGLRKIVACSHSSSQYLLVSTVFGTVSSLHPTSFLIIFTLVACNFRRYKGLCISIILYVVPGQPYKIFALSCYLTPVASAPNNVRAVQENQTSIHLYWTPPSPLGDTTGYIISYTGGSSGIVTVSGGSIDNYLLTGLVMDSSYTISIVATSEHLTSDVLVVEVILGETEMLWITECITKYAIVSLFSLIARPAHCECDLHNSHLHLPLLEYSQ